MATATDLTTAIRGVELVSVGTWDASTGRTRITTNDLAAMVQAYNDPAADAAPIKVGHDDDRFQDANGNPPSTRGGEPAYGGVENLRLSDDGKTLIGDFVGVPTSLAEVMHTALRRRSIEMTRHLRVGGKTYGAVLTGLALLGVQAPAVKGLKDLRALFADQLATPQPERFSLEVSDDTPTVPQSADGNPDRDPQTEHGQTATGVAAMAVKLNPGQRKALGIGDDATDDEIKAVLRKLGLRFAEDDDNDDTTSVTPPAAPAAPATPPAPPAPTPGVPSPGPAVPSPEPHTPAAPPAPAEEPPTAQRVAAAAAQVGLQVVDSVMFAQLRADAEAGRKARDEQDRLRRDALVQGAVREGKIAPAAFAAFRKQADQDESGLVTLLAAMPAILPTTPVGHSESAQIDPATGQPAPEQVAAAAAADAKRAGLYDYFGITAPAAAKG